MSLEKEIEKNYIEAFKAKKEIEVSTLRMLRSALKNLAIDKRISSLEDEDVLSIVKRELKKRQDSIEAFRSAGRDDLLAREEAEARILEKYMPAMLSEEEIDKIIANIISAGHDNFGLVMKEVMAQTKGRADGKIVQEKVKQKLNL
ncbi:MAG: GatB/YqeY domain-containing protein [Patescibacteria group bacterium]